MDTNASTTQLVQPPTTSSDDAVDMHELNTFHNDCFNNDDDNDHRSRSSSGFASLRHTVNGDGGTTNERQSTTMAESTRLPPVKIGSDASLLTTNTDLLESASVSISYTPAESPHTLHMGDADQPAHSVCPFANVDLNVSYTPLPHLSHFDACNMSTVCSTTKPPSTSYMETTLSFRST
jgi:hypothetical protein